MPSELHEVIVSFFTERPELAPLLLERSLGVELPRYSKVKLYLDIIENALGQAARKAFHMLPQHYQFKGPSYREGRADGRAEGKAEGRADSVLVVLGTRGIAVTDEERDRISKCDDLDQLDAWLRRAMTVTHAGALFES